MNFPEAEELLLTARSQITKGLLRVYLSGIEDNMIRCPDHSDDNKNTTAAVEEEKEEKGKNVTSLPMTQFNSSETQFNSRYQYFQYIASPTPLQYSQYLTLVETVKRIQKNSKELLEIAVKCFTSIKDLTEKATEMSKMTQQDQRSVAPKEREKLEIEKHSNLVKVSQKEKFYLLIIFFFLHLVDLNYTLY
jgi:predicted ATPase